MAVIPSERLDYNRTMGQRALSDVYCRNFETLGGPVKVEVFASSRGHRKGGERRGGHVADMENAGVWYKVNNECILRVSYKKPSIQSSYILRTVA